MASVKSGVGLASSQDISMLVQCVNTSLAIIGSSGAPIYTKISFVDDGGQTDGQRMGEVLSTFDNGSGTPGEIVRYPFSPVSNAPSVWHFGKDRDTFHPIIQYLEVTRERHQSGDEKLYADVQDVYGILNQKIPNVLERAGFLFDWLIAGLLNDNPTCFTGKPFFSTDHPCDPNDASKGTFSNDISISALDNTGFAEALDAMVSVKWFDAKTRNSDVKPIVLCPNKSKHLAVRQLVFGSLIPNSRGAQTVAASSEFDGMVEDVLLFPSLLTERPQANAPKYIYLVNPGTPVRAGIIVSPKRPPEYHVAGLNAADPTRVLRGEIQHGWDDFSGVALGLPQDVIRVKVG